MARARGRRSAAEVAVVGTAVRVAERPMPPAELSDYQAAVWLQVVNAMPGGWFDDSNLAMLKAYCQHVQYAREIEDRLSIEELDWMAMDDGLDRRMKLYTAHEKQTGAMARWGTKLRLTPQARILPQTAGRQFESSKAKPLMKPWETA